MSYGFDPNQNYQLKPYQNNYNTQNSRPLNRTNQAVRTNEAVKYRELPFGRMEEHNSKGEVIYQGEMVNYIRNGNGIHYDGNYMYFGQFKDGHYHGTGMLITRPDSKIIYYGHYYEGNPCR